MSLPGQSGEGGEPPHYLHHHLANVLMASFRRVSLCVHKPSDPIHHTLIVWGNLADTWLSLETWLMCIVFIQREVKRVYRILLDEDKEFLGLKIDSG